MQNFLLNPMLCLKSNLQPIINLNFSLILQNSKFSLNLQKLKILLKPMLILKYVLNPNANLKNMSLILMLILKI